MKQAPWHVDIFNRLRSFRLKEVQRVKDCAHLSIMLDKFVKLSRETGSVSFDDSESGAMGVLAEVKSKHRELIEDYENGT